MNGKLIPSNLNSYDVKNRNGKVIVKIIKHSDYYEMVYLNKFTVVVTDTLSITPLNTMKNRFIGVCGNFDGKPTNDRIGPMGCLYTEPELELFKYAWTVEEGQDCDTRHVQEMHKQVNQFQGTCKKPNIMMISALYRK